MPFDTIRFHNFRNLVDAEIPVHRGQVFFIGENGQGKTNFLEALYVLCYGRSFRSSVDAPLIKTGTQEMGIQGSFSSEDAHRLSTTRITIQNGKKEILCDGKLIQDRKELVERIPCIVFCHEDLDFIRGGPEFQRQFFDQTASFLYPGYLADLRDYGKILKTRNLLIKEQNLSLLPTYDIQLAGLGLRLQERRSSLIRDFNLIFSPLFTGISAGIQDVHIRYRANWENLDMNGAIQRLHERLPRDLAMKTTTSGPHRDKFLFYKDQLDFMGMASTGQMRLMSLLLRLSQASMVQKLGGKNPVLLLDDVLLELDFEKRKRFLANLPTYEQAFFTFLPDEQVAEYLKHDALCYRVEKGSFHEASGG